jgi:hypothetical protein
MNTGSKSYCRVFTSVGLAILFLLVSVFAKEYWQAKPFTQWNEQEATAMVTDSPWCRPCAIPGNYGGSAAPRVSEAGKLSGSSLPQIGGGFGGTEAARFYVRWYSSLMVRQALGRLAILRGGLSEAEVNQFLRQPIEDYAIAVSAPVMDPFVAATYDSLKSGTVLYSKKNKSTRIELKSYSSPKGRPDGFAVFFFPRSLNGQPTLDAADDEIVFETEIGSAKIRAAFKLARMMVDGKLDL